MGCGYAILDTMQSRCSPEWADDGEKACKAAATQLGIAFSGQTCTQAAYGCLKRANGVQMNACPQVKDVDTAIYNQGYPICLFVFGKNNNYDDDHHHSSHYFSHH